ncbi:integral membrane protein [Moelleriella libera RCEF 2490]|uniref:Integral membrane protein n=1 Tax=Moelleriella libera RCEF 2490 TaxID=1081109 RepID=A0A168E430_9HYPO|nr:integral membrane protein [Moelleriella libera RCEF 2490]
MSSTAAPSLLLSVGGDDERSRKANKRERPVARTLHTALYISLWIFISNCTILFNKWLIDTRGFPFPILLTCWHLVFATAATQILARTTSLLDSRKKLPLTPRLYCRTIVPIGIFYSGSLVCSNVVYLYLSVPFIQMLKAAAPVAVLFTSWAWRVAEPNLASFLNVLWIVAGVALASVGEIHFSFIGFMYQMGGIVFEAIRIIMIQVLLSGDGMRMDPLVGLYYFAPVCAAMNFLVAIPKELPQFSWAAASDVGLGMLFLNASIAFLLNVTSVFLIGRTSGLVMTLTGIFKNILLILVSILIWSTKITFLQTVGYTIALAGLTYYSLGYEQIIRLLFSSATWTSHLWNSTSTLGRGSGSIATRRCLFLAVLIFGGLFFIAASLQHNDPQSATLFKLPPWFGTE